MLSNQSNCFQNQTLITWNKLTFQMLNNESYQIKQFKYLRTKSLSSNLNKNFSVWTLLKNLIKDENSLLSSSLNTNEKWLMISRPSFEYWTIQSNHYSRNKFRTRNEKKSVMWFKLKTNKGIIKPVFRAFWKKCSALKEFGETKLFMTLTQEILIFQLKYWI